MMVNRSVVLIRPKEPFFQWLRSLPDPCELSIEDYNDDSTAYLLPEYEDDIEQTEVLEQYYDLIFEEVLGGWWTVEGDWPPTRNFATFNDWFSCEFHSLVIDLVADPLIVEE